MNNEVSQQNEGNTSINLYGSMRQVCMSVPKGSDMGSPTTPVQRPFVKRAVVGETVGVPPVPGKD